MGFAAVARVTEERWVACEVLDEIDFGLKAGEELSIETTICSEVLAKLDTVAIDHVADDDEYRDHQTPAMYGFQSYIATPIILQDGTFFGTLCAIDPKPAKINNPETIGTLKLFAELIARHLDASRRLALSEAMLLTEYASGNLREQFIAVLGHDLRNPLASIQAGTKIILRASPDAKIRTTLGYMQKSIDRMAGLIDNVMDFARGRMGGGIRIEHRTVETLETDLLHIVNEMRLGAPERNIDFSFEVDEPVACDKIRLGQLLSNLLSNALHHGSPDGPVRICARIRDRQFELSVSNQGPPISPDAMDTLFLPFTQKTGTRTGQGLGLGLYIASEIALAHNGTLDVDSTEEETRFTFRMPIN